MINCKERGTQIRAPPRMLTAIESSITRMGSLSGERPTATDRNHGAGRVREGARHGAYAVLIAGVPVSDAPAKGGQ